MQSIPVIMILLPLVAAGPSYLLARRRLSHGYVLTAAVTLLVTGLGILLALSGVSESLHFPRLLGLGLSLKADGFRAIYAAVAGFMWLMTSLFTPQYMSHGHRHPRYLMYTLFTMGATIGVFLSDDLITTFLFFEVMSFTSYCWVAHEQTPGAMRAGQTYLAIAVLGGMAMLMGLMMLHGRLGSLAFEQLAGLGETADKSTLYLPGALILAGFGAKAGMFPLHVWLPKAHPVAPAPASALLSGILTKVGIFGILVISTRLFFGNLLWGNVLLILGLINMFLGAVLALFSIDLKRTLACSSMSQIGFILVGIGMQCLLGEHNALAAQGTVLHMLNHSLIKLCLFMAAGVVYVHLHQLDLNKIRGFGRGRFGLMVCFLAGAASISGIPLFSGYASKTLLHESIVEYIDHLHHLGQGAFWYQAAEWVFIISGGITFCYMLKLFVALFIEKNNDRQEAFDQMGRSMTPLSAVALGGSALLIFLIGLWPEGVLAPLANRMLPFLHAHEPAHAVHFLAPINVIGALKSLLIGAVLYFTLVRRWLITEDQDGGTRYVNRWPEKLDLENAVYRPLVDLLVRLGTLLCQLLNTDLGNKIYRHLADLLIRLSELICLLLDNLVDRVLYPLLFTLGTFLARAADWVIEGSVLMMMNTVFRRTRESTAVVPVGNRFTFALGSMLDSLSFRIRRVFGRQASYTPKYIYVLSAAWNAAFDVGRRLLRTMSFSLILFALMLVLLLAFLMTR